MGEWILLKIRVDLKQTKSRKFRLSKSLQYDVDAVVGIDGGRLDHRIGAFTALLEPSQMQFYISMVERAGGVSGLEIELES